MTTHTEIEQKFDAPTEGGLPDMSGLSAAVAEATEVNLEATYFDTDDLRLAARHLTLRRRTGGDDAGWHLKIPTGPDERLERRRPLGRSVRAVPKPLLREVRAIVRDRPLVPIAVLRTRRIEHRLLDADGAALAVVADDTVHAERLTAEPSQSMVWREVEVELVDGDRDLLAAVAERFCEHGLTPSPSASKLARALGTDAEPGATGAAPAAGEPGTAGQVLLTHLGEQVTELTARDRAARADEPDGVHKMRVATRRLRSAMATYRPVLERSQTDPIRADLKWLGQLLGRARDAEVQRERLQSLLAEQPSELVLGPVRRRIDLELQARHRDAHAALVRELDAVRYWRLLDNLDDLLEHPALTRRASRAAQAQLPRIVAQSLRRFDKAAERAAAASGAEGDTALHELRKAAKRARYAAESAAPTVGEPANRLAARLEDVQEVLGEHQDSVTGRALLRELAIAAHGAGENGFTFGVLHREEGARGEAAQARAEKAVQKAATSRVRRWLA
jgi:CHAD domain-containing protein